MFTLSSQRVFDEKHYDDLNSSRAAVVTAFLREVGAPLGLRAAIDVGCSLGYFCGVLRSLGLDVTGVEGRSENAEEAKRRNPGIIFHTLSVEDPRVCGLGSYDLVFCFGLLYHLENPFLAIRHLHAMTRRLLLVEAVVFPGEAPVLGLVDESDKEDQGLNHVALYPTEACLVRMLYRTGFSFVYRFSPLPSHPGYRVRGGLPRVRTMLAASFEPLASSALEGVREHAVEMEPSNSVSVAANMHRWGLSRGLRQWLAAQRIRFLGAPASSLKQDVLELTFDLRNRLGLRRSVRRKPAGD